jgi:hypothetical protein
MAPKSSKRSYWIAFTVLVLVALGLAGGTPQSMILQIQNAGSAIATIVNYGVLNCSTGMSCSANGSTVTLTATGSGGVTSVTFTGDGTVLSSTPSSAVTTTGTLTATMANAAAGSILGNATASAATPTYLQQPSLGAVGGSLGQMTYLGSTSGSATFGCGSATCGTLSSSTIINASKFNTATNCALGGASGTTSPAACAAAPTGHIAIPASQTTYTVNTTNVTASSNIFIQQIADNSGIASSPTCNATATNPIQSARVAATSFTFTLTTNGAVTCYAYWITN